MSTFDAVIGQIKDKLSSYQLGLLILGYSNGQDLIFYQATWRTLR